MKALINRRSKSPFPRRKSATQLIEEIEEHQKTMVRETSSTTSKSSSIPGLEVVPIMSSRDEDYSRTSKSSSAASSSRRSNNSRRGRSITRAWLSGAIGRGISKSRSKSRPRGSSQLALDIDDSFDNDTNTREDVSLLPSGREDSNPVVMPSKSFDRSVVSRAATVHTQELDNKSVKDVSVALKDMEKQLRIAKRQGETVSRAKVMSALLSMVDTLEPPPCDSFDDDEPKDATRVVKDLDESFLPPPTRQRSRLKATYGDDDDDDDGSSDEESDAGASQASETCETADSAEHSSSDASDDAQTTSEFTDEMDGNEEDEDDDLEDEDDHKRTHVGAAVNNFFKSMSFVDDNGNNHDDEDEDDDDNQEEEEHDPEDDPDDDPDDERLTISTGSRTSGTHTTKDIDDSVRRELDQQSSTYDALYASMANLGRMSSYGWQPRQLDKETSNSDEYDSLTESGPRAPCSSPLMMVGNMMTRKEVDDEGCSLNTGPTLNSTPETIVSIKPLKKPATTPLSRRCDCRRPTDYDDYDDADDSTNNHSLIDMFSLQEKEVEAAFDDLLPLCRPIRAHDGHHSDDAGSISEVGDDSSATSIEWGSRVHSTSSNFKRKTLRIKRRPRSRRHRNGATSPSERSNRLTFPPVTDLHITKDLNDLRSHSALDWDDARKLNNQSAPAAEDTSNSSPSDQQTAKPGGDKNNKNWFKLAGRSLRRKKSILSFDQEGASVDAKDRAFTSVKQRDKAPPTRVVVCTSNHELDDDSEQLDDSVWDNSVQRSRSKKKTRVSSFSTRGSTSSRRFFVA